MYVYLALVAALQNCLVISGTNKVLQVLTESTEHQFINERWKTKTKRYIIARHKPHRQSSEPGGRSRLQRPFCR